jgi:hypothetical protein
MAAPSIASRLERRFIVASADGAMVERLRAVTPPGWSLVATLDLSALGGFQDILQHRFLLLDLDAHGDLDPLELIADVRGGLMLNIPIFCFGGEPARRDAARLARADRFFEREEMLERLPQFCEQFGWGG